MIPDVYFAVIHRYRECINNGGGSNEAMNSRGTNMMTAGCRITMLLMLLITPLRAVDLSPFRYLQPISGDARDLAEVAAVAIDDQAWEILADGCRDLILADDKGQVVPYMLRRASEIKTYTANKPLPAKVEELKTKEDNAIEVLIRLQDNSPSADSLEIKTPLEDFERKVTVHGQDDSGGWILLADDVLIYDYSRFMDVRQVTVDLNKNEARLLKVTVSAVIDELRSPFTEIRRRQDSDGGTSAEEIYAIWSRPFRIDSIELRQSQKKEQVKSDLQREYTVTDVSVQPDEKSTDTIIDIKVLRQPVNKITLQINGDNFFRDVKVQVPVVNNGRSDWRTIGSGRIHRITVRKTNRESLAVEIPEHRADTYRVLIKNNDNPPLDITGALISGPVYDVTFVAAADRNYTLYYGAKGRRAPVYDTAAIMAVLGRETPPRSLLAGERIENPAWEDAGRSWTEWLGSRGFFIAAVLVVMLVLVAGIFRAGKQLEDRA